MCGICGKVTKENGGIKDVELNRMRESLSHRGPDGEGNYVARKVGLGMRRLSIIDLSGGSQPLFNEDKTIVVVGNGEIYNYIELQKELKKRGHVLRTGSDIETIAHLYEDFGINGVKQLRGMFALALYDIKRHRVVLMRDRLGEKPLYWTKVPNGVVFSSEMKSLLSASGVRKKINEGAIKRFFNYFYIPEPETMFEGVHKLAPGELMEIDIRSWEFRRDKYWDAKQVEVNDVDDPTEKIRQLFEESCRLTLRADVPVGISLSGGIDSGAILAMSAPFYKDKMKAFSIGYQGRPLSDEREMARKLARKYKVEFIEKEISIDEVIEHFPRLVLDMDDPIADIAGHSIYSVSKLARDNGIKVLLGGLGGDELFWGYPWMGQAIKESLSKFHEEKTWKGKLGLFLNPTEKNKMIFYQNNPGFKSTMQFINRLFTREFINRTSKVEVDSYMRTNDRFELGVARKGMDLIRDIWLVSNCIDLGDRLSMAASVELRSPFLDFRLVETVLANQKIVQSYNKPPKYWFKKAMKGVLPDEVLNRPKRGFTPPVGEWIKGILNRYIFLLRDGFLVKEGVFERRKINGLCSAWIGLPMYWYSIYQALLLEVWGRTYCYQQRIKELQ